MKDFKDEFYKYITLFQEKEPIAFVRYGDGEHMLIDGREVSTITQAYKIDKWSAPAVMSKLGADLKLSLSHTESNYHYAIPCQCCNRQGKEYYLNTIHQKEDNITYANLFINGNYPLWMNYIQSMGQHIVLIANKNSVLGRQNLLPLHVDTFFGVPDDCVNFYEKHGERYINYVTTEFKNIKNQLVFVSGGPMAKVLIHHLFLTNPSNRYIDVGSSIDEIIHGKQTRPFMMKGSEYYSRDCVL
jgi:hypothetical protein